MGAPSFAAVCEGWGTAVALAIAITAAGCVGTGGRDRAAGTARLDTAIARAEARDVASDGPGASARSEAFAPHGSQQGQPGSGVRGFTPDASGDVRLVRFAAADESAEASPAEAPDAETDEIRRGPPGGLFDSIEQDFDRIFEDLWQDTKRVYTDPTNLGILLVAGGASAALRPEVDDDVEDKFRESQSFKHDIRDALGAVGNPGTHFALAGLWYLIGTEGGDTKTYEVAKTLFSGLIINGVSTMGLKVATYTDSPNGEILAWPSGHTSSSFTVASIMHQAYGHAVGIPLYGLAGLAAFERLDSEEHHLSDVVFGAAMGLVVGHTVATGHRPQIFGGDLIPFADADDRSGGIAWMKGF